MDFDVGIAYDADVELAKKLLADMVKDDKRVLPDGGVSVYVYELGAYSVGVRLRVWTSVEDYWPLYNELPEKVLLAFRENNIYIPSSTDRTISKS